MIRVSNEDVAWLESDRLTLATGEDLEHQDPHSIAEQIGLTGLQCGGRGKQQ